MSVEIKPRRLQGPWHGGYALDVHSVSSTFLGNDGAGHPRFEILRSPTGFAYLSAKNLVMSQEAGCGLMLWDGKSKGTLQNMLRLIGAEKRTLVYFAPTGDFHVLANESDLQTLLARCRKRDLDLAARGLRLKAPLTQTHLLLASV